MIKFNCKIPLFYIWRIKMKDIKPTIAKNLSFFRKQSGLTQAELAGLWDSLRDYGCLNSATEMPKF